MSVLWLESYLLLFSIDLVLVWLVIYIFFNSIDH